jgi:glycosyltransferase involved in cell wall biosynthesis
MRDVNPYGALLYTRLAALGIAVDEFNVQALLRGTYDVWHIHWPDRIASPGNAFLALKRALGFIVLLGVAKLRGVKVIWTVHNLRPHEPRHPRVQRLVRMFFLRAVDGYLSLSDAAKEETQRLYPRLSRIPGFVTRHGHYRGVYPDSITRELARATLGLPAQAYVFLFFGQIRPYKNLVALLHQFAQYNDPNSRLVIAGHAPEPEYGDTIREIAAHDPRVVCRLSFVADQDIQTFMRAADLVVLPYVDILNSGAALLALSFEVPVLVPAKGSMAELQDAFGSYWVRLYNGEFNTERLREETRKQPVDPSRVAELETGLHQHDWSVIAANTVTAFDAVVQGH